MGITEDIRKIKEVRERTLLALKQDAEMRRPTRHNPKEIPSIYEDFKRAANPLCRDNSRIFVLLIYYMYKPESLAYGRGCRGEVRCEIAKIMHVGIRFVSHLFEQAKFLVANNKDFRVEVERIFAKLNV